MPTKLDIYGVKCFNQLRNGEQLDQNLLDFTPNLVGNPGEVVRIEFTVDAQKYAAAEGYQTWAILNNPSNIIERAGGSFVDDGVRVGDVYRFYADFQNRRTQTEEYAGRVDFVSSDGKQLRYSVLSGSDTTGGVEIENVGLVFPLSQNPVDPSTDNYLRAVFVEFGLLNGSEPFNNISKTTGEPQTYYVGDLPRGGSFTEATPKGSPRSWVSGLMSVQFTGDTSDFKGARYVVSHVFRINPFLTSAYKALIQNGETPDIFKEDSLKYATSVKLRKTLSDVSSEIEGVLEDLPGFVGWFNQNFNGLNPGYKVVSTTYEDTTTGDPLEAVNKSGTTKSIIEIEGVDGPITDFNAAVYLFKVPVNSSEYINTPTDLDANLMTRQSLINAPGTSGDLTATLNAGVLTLEFVSEYTLDEKLVLENGDFEYLLCVQVEDSTLSAGGSDRIMLIADLKEYTSKNYLVGFAKLEDFKIFTHGQDLDGSGADLAELELCNEDGVYVQTDLVTNIVRNVVVQGVGVGVVAYNENTGAFFDLDRFQLPLTGRPVISGGSQKINVEGLRGYALAEGDPFNIVKLVNKPKQLLEQPYLLGFGQKISWQDWRANFEVPDVFYDEDRPNDNKNFKASNYDVEGFGIYFFIDVSMSGFDELGRFISGVQSFKKGPYVVQDYEESAAGVTGVIETFDPDTGLNLNGEVLLNGRDTLFKTTFQNAASMVYAIHRLEVSQNPGNLIYELSSVAENLEVGNPLKPLFGGSKLTFEQDGGEVVTRCIIKGSEIVEGSNYKLSARIIGDPANLGDPFEFTVDTTNGGSPNTFTLPLLNAGVYDIIMDRGDGSNLVSFNTWDDPARVLTYDTPGVYTVKLYGVITGWSFESGGDRLKLTEVKNWGPLKLNSTPNVFNGCANLTITATDAPDLTECTNLGGMFSGCVAITDVPGIGTWDVSNVTSLASMFTMSNFNGALDSWDVSSVTSLSRVFENTPFNQPLDSWDVSSVTTMVNMFRSTPFNQSLNSWDVSNVTNLSRVFEVSNFNQPLNSWDVSNVTDFTSLFASTPFNQDISAWDVSSAQSIRGMFASTPFNQDVSAWNVSNVINAGLVFLNTPFNQDVSAWDVSSVTDMSRMFDRASDFNQPLNSWDVSSVVNMNRMFLNAGSFNQPLNSWDVSSVTDMSEMFYDSALNSYIGAWDVSSVTDMSDMFRASPFNQAIGAWDVSSVVNMQSMFFDCLNFNRDLSAWVVPNVVNFESFLVGASSFSTSNLDELLNGLQAQGAGLQNDVVFGASTPRSAVSDSAVSYLTTTRGWTINTGI